MKLAISSVIIVGFVQIALGSTPPSPPQTTSVNTTSSPWITASPPPTTATWYPNGTITTASPTVATPYPCIIATSVAYNHTSYTSAPGNASAHGNATSSAHNNGNATTVSVSDYPTSSGIYCPPYYPNGTVTTSSSVIPTSTFDGNTTVPSPTPSPSSNSTNGNDTTPQNANGNTQPPSSATNLKVGISGAALAVVAAIISSL